MGDSAAASTSCHRERCRSSWRPARRARPAEPFPWDVQALLRRCKPPEPVPMGGCLVRGLLTDSEQAWLLAQLVEMGEPASDEFDSLRRTATPADQASLNPDNRPQPFVTWVHPYTRTSNAKRRPTRLLRWAEELMHSLVRASRGSRVDSMLAQMYAPGGSLLPHRDEDLS